jgi:uncharacterized Zn finger protein (UPF0148 family)
VTMNAMIDASCPKCRRRFGWCGTLANRPACPMCGHRPPQSELDAEAAEMEAFHERLRTHPGRADGETRRQQRVDAGLTLRQAAKLLGILPVELNWYEKGIQPPESVCARMAEVYGVGNEV